MKTIRYVFWGLVGLVLIVVALANTGLVELRAMPDGLAELLAISPVISLPLYAVIYAGVAFGLLIGFVWEWLREFRIRSDSRSKSKEIKRLERELEALRRGHDSPSTGKDEILALIDAK